MASELNLEIAGLLLKDQGDRSVEQRDDPDAAVLLDRLERNGILAPPDLAFEGRWRAAQWSPTLRRVIRDDFVRRHPALTSGIDAVMADWYVANGAPGRSLTHAARAGQWDLLFSLLKTHSTSVLDGDWQEFSRAVTAAPYEVISDNAVGAAWRAIALNLPIDPQVTPDPRRLTSEEAAVIGRSPRAREELQDQFWQHMLYRRRGLFEQARIASDNAKKIMQEAILVGTQGVVGLQSLVLTHSGYLHEILGDLRTATGEFIEAHKQAPLSELSFSAADAAGKAALSYAMLGDSPNATVWLRREAVAPVPQGSVTPFVRSAGLIARALIASVQLQADQCAAAIDALGGITRMDELWPFAAFARGRQALLWGDCDNALDELEDLMTSPDMLASTLATGGVASWLMPSGKAELLMALGRGNQALAVLDEADSDHPMVNLARARLALLSGDNETAIALTTTTGDLPSSRTSTSPSGASHRITSPLQRLEGLIIRGIANNRLGASEAAVGLLRRSVNQAERLEALLPFARVPRQELIAIAELEPSLARLLEIRALSETPDVYPSRVDVVTLNEREQAILDGFSAGLSFRQIATNNFVSTNTIKSQTQALYRKLRVSSREEALAAAGVLQLHKVANNIQPDRQLTVVQDPDLDESSVPTADLQPGSDVSGRHRPHSSQV
jgi:LuxR family maltose regulon positive regulatory protein